MSKPITTRRASRVPLTSFPAALVSALRSCGIVHPSPALSEFPPMPEAPAQHPAQQPAHSSGSGGPGVFCSHIPAGATAGPFLRAVAVDSPAVALAGHTSPAAVVAYVWLCATDAERARMVPGCPDVDVSLLKNVGDVVSALSFYARLPPGQYLPVHADARVAAVLADYLPIRTTVVDDSPAGERVATWDDLFPVIAVRSMFDGPGRVHLSLEMRPRLGTVLGVGRTFSPCGGREVDVRGRLDCETSDGPDMHAFTSDAVSDVEAHAVHLRNMWGASGAPFELHPRAAHRHPVLAMALMDRGARRWSV